MKKNISLTIHFQNKLMEHLNLWRFIHQMTKWLSIVILLFSIHWQREIIHCTSLEMNGHLEGNMLQHYANVGIFDLILSILCILQWGFWPKILLKSHMPQVCPAPRPSSPLRLNIDRFIRTSRIWKKLPKYPLPIQALNTYTKSCTPAYHSLSRFSKIKSESQWKSPPILYHSRIKQHRENWTMIE